MPKTAYHPRLQRVQRYLTTEPPPHWLRFAVATTLGTMAKPHPSRLRRPVTSFGRYYIVCDDGAVFLYDEPSWEEVSPIPGSPRAEEVDHPAPTLLGPPGASTLPRAASEG